jgi:hypothetical protein
LLSRKWAFFILLLSRTKVGVMDLQDRFHTTASVIISGFEMLCAELRGLYNYAILIAICQSQPKVTLFKISTIRTSVILQ